MITQVIYLEKYDWLIKVYYAITDDSKNIILDELEAVDCPEYEFEQIKNIFKPFRKNTGFTYTDAFKKVTFIVISITDSAEEFANTYDHEKGHAAMHIAEYFNIDPYLEELQYLQGKIGQEMFPIAKNFLCENCRNKIIVFNYGKIKLKNNSFIL